MKLSDLGKGYALLNAGQWIGDLPFALFAGIRFKVRRVWNEDFTALYEKLKADGKTDDEAFNECLARASLLDWDGVDDAFSADTAIALLADPDAGSIFRNAVLWAVGKLADEVKATIEADAKN